MRIPFFAPPEKAPPEGAEAAPSAGEQLKELLRRRGRRGATSLEYVVVASLILVVVVAVVQHLGWITDGLFQKSANATTNMGTGS